VRSGFSTSTMNDSGTASLFQQSTTELDALSSWNFNNRYGRFIVDGNLGRWNLQQEENEGRSDLFYDWREASLTGATYIIVKQADCDEIQAVISQPVPKDVKVSSMIMPKRMESLTCYDDVSAALSSPHPRGGQGGLSSRPSLSSSPGFFFSGAYPLSQHVNVTHDAAAAPPRIPKRMPSLLDCDEIQAVFSQPVPEDDAKVSSPTIPNRMESLTGYDDISAALSSPHHPRGQGGEGLSSWCPSSLSSSPGYFFYSGAYPLSQHVDVTHDTADPPRIPKRMPSLLDCDEIQAVFSKPVPEDDAKVSSPPTMPKRMESLADYDDVSAALSSPHPRGLSSSPGFFFSGANPPRIPCRRESIIMDTAQK
jgi:hypothetical protein